MLQSKESDHVADEKISLHVIGEVAAGYNGTSGDRANFFFEQFVHFEAVALWADLVGAAAGAIGGKTIAPVVERGAVGVG